MSKDHVIVINEGRIEATGRGAARWYARRPAFVASGSLREITPPCIVGGEVEIGPYAVDDAEFMIEHMINQGCIPSSAVRIKRRVLRRYG